MRFASEDISDLLHSWNSMSLDYLISPFASGTWLACITFILRCPLSKPKGLRKLLSSLSRQTQIIQDYSVGLSKSNPRSRGIRNATLKRTFERKNKQKHQGQQKIRGKGRKLELRFSSTYPSWRKVKKNMWMLSPWRYLG